MVGWYHQLNELEFEQTLGDSEGQKRPAFYSSWGCKESDTAVTEQNIACVPCIVVTWAYVYTMQGPS